MTKVNKTVQINKSFMPLLDNTDRYNLLMGGGGSGKSHFVVQKMIGKALKSTRRVLVVRKVQKDIRNSIFKLFIDALKDFGIYNLCKITTTYMQIELPNGSEFQFIGLEDPERIKSITGIDDIVIEEVTELSLEDYMQLQIRLRSNKPNPQIHMMMNPVSKGNWTYKHFFEQKQPQTRLHHSTFEDNQFLPQANIDTLLSYKVSNPLYYKIYALGQFGNLDRTIFDNWRVEKVDDHGDLLVGMDFGFSADPTSLIGCYVKGNQLYVVGESYKKGMFVENMVTELQSKGWEHYSIACDSAEPRTIADLKRQHIKSYPVKKGKDSILHGITWLQQMEIVIDPSCTNLIEEMKDYTWLKDKDGVYINKPNPNSADHAIDALRYATEILRTGNNKPKFINKSALGL